MGIKLFSIQKLKAPGFTRGEEFQKYALSGGLGVVIIGSQLNGRNPGSGGGEKEGDGFELHGCWLSMVLLWKK